MVCEKCEKCDCKQLTPEEELNGLYDVAKKILEVDNLNEKDLRNIVKDGAHNLLMEAHENGKTVDEYLETYNISVLKIKYTCESID